MATSKNKLQSIYSSAVSKLAELETSQRQILEEISTKYLNTDKDARSDLSKSAASKQDLLADEIRTFLTASMTRIKSAVDVQSMLTNNCLNRSTQRLMHTSRKYEEELTRMKSRQDVVYMDSLDELSAQFSAAVEQSLMSFRNMQSEWSKKLRERQASMRSNLEQVIVSGVALLRQNEHEFTTSAQSAAIEHTTTLRAEAEKLNTKLRAECEEQVESLQKQLDELDFRLQEHQEAVLTDAEAQAQEVGANLTEHFEKIYATPAAELMDIISKHRAALQNAFAAGTVGLTTPLEKVKSEVTRAGDERLQSVDARADDVRNRINSVIESLNRNLNDSLESSVKLEKELERNNEEVSSGVRNELTNLFESFRRKMEESLESTVGKLAKSCRDVGQELGAARKESELLLNAVSSNVEHEIHTALSQMLKRVKEARKAALEKVERAGTGIARAGEADAVNESESVSGATESGGKPGAGNEAQAGSEN